MHDSTNNSTAKNDKPSELISATDNDVRTRFVSDFVSYMRDCEFTTDEAYLYCNIIHAIAISYRPIPEFWRKLDIDIVATALNVYSPTTPFKTPSAYRDHAENMQDIDGYLFMNQHDELNAELLAQLPKFNRPDDAGAAADWICEQHERRGDITNLEYAERDGYKCGRAALSHLARLEAAANGKVILSIDAKLAEDERKHAMMLRTGQIKPAVAVDRDEPSKLELFSISIDGEIREISIESIDSVEHEEIPR